MLLPFYGNFSPQLLSRYVSSLTRSDPIQVSSVEFGIYYDIDYPWLLISRS